MSPQNGSMPGLKPTLALPGPVVPFLSFFPFPFVASAFFSAVVLLLPDIQFAAVSHWLRSSSLCGEFFPSGHHPYQSMTYRNFYNCEKQLQSSSVFKVHSKEKYSHFGSGCFANATSHSHGYGVSNVNIHIILDTVSSCLQPSKCILHRHSSIVKK